ncbi:hypothetical protein M1105_14510 [Limibaculum sp. FT325]|uniref:hypothetical protein n=1 Tax=Thermohalobaculum sediminis TaxID=2939436 RepID=UPI0020C12757|nr:hypothetical protein [Limibaculum sediminis]MCL5778193.1 hypothetical protein [Limibaculum sediminis]
MRDTAGRPMPRRARQGARSVLGALVAGALAAAAPSIPTGARAQETGQRLDMEEFKRKLDEAWDEMMRELGPTIDSLGALMETLDRIDSLEHYERPEILPNGDIVIRRRPDAPPLPEAPGEKDEPAGQTPGIRT